MYNKKKYDLFIIGESELLFQKLLNKTAELCANKLTKQWYLLTLLIFSDTYKYYFTDNFSYCNLCNS